MCYYHIWQPINPGKSKWDSDYHTDMREWGCTESLETCQSTCASTGCNTAKRACCSADTYQLSHNYTDDNILAYRQCYYGNMAHSPRLPTSLLICCLALFYGGWCAVMWLCGFYRYKHSVVGNLYDRRWLGFKRHLHGGTYPCFYFDHHPSYIYEVL